MVNKNIILNVNDLSVHYPLTHKVSWPWQRVPVLKAVDGVSFSLNKKQTLGIVGESGCGKSTLVRSLLGLVPVHSGGVEFFGEKITSWREKDLHDLRQRVQMVFQDPLAALNPRMTIGDCIAEPLKNYPMLCRSRERQSRVFEVMEQVGLARIYVNRYPHELSGGQNQRVGMARALILKPDILICDEAVSALDVSIQAQVLNLLMDLKQSLGLSLLFITHDIHVVKTIADDILVMNSGKIVEKGSASEICEHPQHAYTQTLMAAIPYIF
jgi:oligopeptide transport system ATP-binding protein